MNQEFKNNLGSATFILCVVISGLSYSFKDQIPSEYLGFACGIASISLWEFIKSLFTNRKSLVTVCDWLMTIISIGIGILFVIALNTNSLIGLDKGAKFDGTNISIWSLMFFIGSTIMSELISWLKSELK
ncbi:hypothetical protein [Neisseria dumasiana]|uniref:Uncharacterized protein n=1 Tax=Neisseria dumasiana TaxID=1931275 RepID=A0ABX3WLH5_9NEIS|nr:hypothetical protein [Neisseria dumasiana]OSI33464.1 hypothetical protein BV913_08540 [Neisseria dumasiana]UOO85108.1 hypothetical protein LVJ88_03735 [Neisseria dumasiana]